MGQTEQSLTCSIMEKSHTGLDVWESYSRALEQGPLLPARPPDSLGPSLKKRRQSSNKRVGSDNQSCQKNQPCCEIQRALLWLAVPPYVVMSFELQMDDDWGGKYFVRPNYHDFSILQMGTRTLCINGHFSKSESVHVRDRPSVSLYSL